MTTTIEPLRASITVGRSPADAFRLFTRDMGTWWPLDVHSLAVDEYDGRVRVESLAFEEHEGGRIVERMSDGTEGMWGTVLVWRSARTCGAGMEAQHERAAADGARGPVHARRIRHVRGAGAPGLGATGRAAREAGLDGEGWVGVLSMFAAAAEGTTAETRGVDCRATDARKGAAPCPPPRSSRTRVSSPSG